jgi:thiosulfate dehydrogenase [quinone] large subunit
MDRRTVMLGGSAVAAAAIVGTVAAGTAAGLGRAIGGAPSPASSATAALPATTPTTVPATTTTTGPAASSTTVPVPAGTRIGRANQVPVGGAASFQDPSTGDPGLILQLTQGQFVAYDAVCPHAGCTVGYAKGAKLIVCPCHGSQFDPTTGAVVSPPAQRGLAPIHVSVSAAGEIYVDG